ncbi:MAG: NAD(P)-binding domain-containing protein, partial [Bacteroidota bacterium]
PPQEEGLVEEIVALTKAAYEATKRSLKIINPMSDNSFHPQQARIGIIGLGYVGLPLATVFSEAGYRVLGFDVSRAVCDGINAGHSHIKDIPTPRLAPLVEQGLVEATTDFERLAE